MSEFSPNEKAEGRPKQGVSVRKQLPEVFLLEMPVVHPGGDVFAVRFPVHRRGSVGLGGALAPPLAEQLPRGIPPRGGTAPSANC